MRIQPGEITRFTADYLNQQMERLDALLHMAVVSPLTLDRRGDTPILSIVSALRITARLTGHLTSSDSYSAGNSAGDSADSAHDEDTCKYSFVEVRVDPNTCSAPDLIGGFVGFTDVMPAVHIGGDTDIPEESIIEMWRSVDGSHWEFGSVGAAGGGLILDVVTCVSLLSADFTSYSDGTIVPG